MNARSAKSFSISCPAARAAVVLLAVLLVAAPAGAKKNKKPSDPNELFNPLLGLDYSQWLVGPIADIATPEEIDQYLALADDEAAQRFIDAFWARRAEGIGFFEKKPIQIFEERAKEADKRFSEGAFPGRQTDRGRTWILYGEPEEITYESAREVNVPILEVWSYPKDAAAGLDGEKPQRRYRFVEIDGSKVLYTNQRFRPDPLDRDRLRPDGF